MGRERRHDLVVRDATVADVSALRMLLIEANTEFHDAMPPKVFANYLDNLVDLVGDDPPAGMLIVEHAEDGLVGTGTIASDAHTLHSIDWPAEHAVFRAMAVDPKVRGTGAGSVVGR